MKRIPLSLLIGIALIVAVSGCEALPSDADLSSDQQRTTAEREATTVEWRAFGLVPGAEARVASAARRLKAQRANFTRETEDEPYELTGEVFDIETAPDGSILFTQNFSVDPPTAPASYSSTLVRQIRKGEVSTVREVNTGGSPLHGVEAVGRRSLFVASGGLDLAEGAGVYHVTQGRARLVGDIQAFETENDPDALEGPQWKDPACEFNPDAGFSAGPHSNPYQLTTLNGSKALVADGAGNTLLTAGMNGRVEWVAVFTPPVVEGDWLVLFPLNEETNCYVQPVPTSVAVGPDGAMYVGELIGVTPAELGGEKAPALARVWRIEPGAEQVVCPSDQCEEVLSGFTSVIDLAFGPDGDLYVVEYDENGWFAVVTGAELAGGTINRCDVAAGICDPVATSLSLPSAITFDKWGNLWLLESNIVNPTVRKLDLP